MPEKTLERLLQELSTELSKNGRRNSGSGLRKAAQRNFYNFSVLLTPVFCFVFPLTFGSPLYLKKRTMYSESESF